MTLERFVHILDQFPHLQEIELQGLGEPFLNPQIVDMIRAARDRQIMIHTFTNGSRLTPDLADRIVQAGLHSITFSIDGASAEVFASLRVRGELDQLLTNIESLRRAKAAQGSEFPYLNMNTVISRGNVHQVEDLIALAQEMGDIRNLAFVRAKKLIAPEFRDLALSEEEHRDLEERYTGKHGDLQVRFYFHSMSLDERRRCMWPREWTYITVEGYVTPCCNYFDYRDFHLGNVFVQPFEEIWNGPAYEQFRRQLSQGELRGPCSEC